MAVQEFNPDNVLVSEKTDGTFTPKMTEVLMRDVRDNSLVMQLGNYVEMNGKQEVEFTFQTDGLSAYWVDEGEKIQTSKPAFQTATMRAKKLGVILIASREYLYYTWSEFFNAMRPDIADAFYTKLDQAAILNQDNPFAFSIEQSVANAGNVVEGDLTYENILAVEDKIYDGGGNVSAFITSPRNHSLLRVAVDPLTKLPIYDRNTKVLDGITTVGYEDLERGNLYALDAANIRYGVPYNIAFKVSEDGTLSTIKNSDGTDVNLFEQELIALRATMDVAFMTVKDEGFAKIQAAPVV